MRVVGWSLLCGVGSSGVYLGLRLIAPELPRATTCLAGLLIFYGCLVGVAAAARMLR